MRQRPPRHPTTAASRAAVGRWAPLAALAVIWVVMTVANPRFVSAVNLTNLTLQIVAVGTIAAGVVLVLLIGEIDLSVGAVSGLGAAVIAVLTMHHGWSAALAVLTGVAVGAAAGVLHGLLVTRVGIPSFVVTLAGLLTWQGVLLLVLGDTGTVNITERNLVAVSGTFLSPPAGWAIGVLVVALAVAAIVRGRARSSDDVVRDAWPWAVAAVAAVAVVAMFNADRGTPLVIVLFLVLLAALDVVVRRTRFGRHVMAIGSNATAARRAGIPVMRIRVVVFAMASMLAVAGGILAASRLLAVNQSSGSTDLMLAAVAAAVIGGASLFGGRGSMWSALIGALVVGSLANGLDLLGASSAMRSIATGVVLAAAVGLDTVTRGRAGTTGSRVSSRRRPAEPASAVGPPRRDPDPGRGG